MYRDDYWKDLAILLSYTVISLIVGLVLAVPFRKLNQYSGGKQGKIRRYALRAERAFYCLNRLGMVCSSIIIIHVNIQKIVIQVMINMHKIYRQISSQTLTKKYDIDII